MQMYVSKRAIARTLGQIAGTSGYAGEPLREQTASAAFRSGNGGAVGGDDFGDDLFKGRCGVREDAIAESKLKTLDHLIEN